MQSNKFAVVTGASSGIGRSAALELAQAGYRMCLASRDLEKLRQVASEITSSGGEAYPVQCDVSDSRQVDLLAEQVGHLTPHIDLLFNNAGSGLALPLEETTDIVWEKTIGSVLGGTFYCTRQFLPLLKKSPSALIINNASVAAHRGFPNFAAYAAAKGGVLAFSRALREELRSHSIRVTILSAGATDTPFWDGVEGEWDRSRMMTCETIGQLIRHIAEFPDCAQLEEIRVMPTGGAL